MAGPVKDVFGQWPAGRSNPFLFYNGIIQFHCHLWCTPNTLPDASGALWLSVVTALGIPVWHSWPLAW